MAETKTMRVPEEVAEEARRTGMIEKAPTGEMLARAWYRYLAEHDEELDRLEDEARAERKKLAAKHPAARRPKPDGGRTYA